MRRLDGVSRQFHWYERNAILFNFWASFDETEFLIDRYSVHSRKNCYWCVGFCCHQVGVEMFPKSTRNSLTVVGFSYEKVVEEL